MLNKKRLILLTLVTLAVVIVAAYVFTGGGFSLNSVDVGGKTLRLKQNDSIFGFTSGEKYSINDTIHGRFLNVTLDNAEIIDDLGDLKVADKEDLEFFNGTKVKEGYKIVKLDFTLENIGSNEENINSNYLYSKNISQYPRFGSEINEEDIVHSAFLVKLQPGETKKNSIGYLLSEDELKESKGDEFYYQFVLPLREKVKDDEVSQVEYFFFNFN
ncbi:hypothetical protein [Lagierella sp.]|uniref:hypothetical protein n=1 Tax=Lagierella sp. TaxID=2849657 RepID=UPI00260EF708|nr:hypothetical protein [Lagierella sp.]